MTTAGVIVVHLRQPKRNDQSEMRSDPFYEFGSFGCTKCHSSNLMHPARADELDGARLAFAQGGPLGFRLVHLSPPARVLNHRDRCELQWSPAEPPFRYDAAPLLVDSAGESDFPSLRASLRRIRRNTWPARFSSAFRSRRDPLSESIAQEMVRVFDRLRARATPAALASTYIDSLPYPPLRPDNDRAATLERLRALANASVSNKKSRCSSSRKPEPTDCQKQKTAPQKGRFKRGGRDSNPQPPDRQSGTLTN